MEWASLFGPSFSANALIWKFSWRWRTGVGASLARVQSLTQLVLEARMGGLPRWQGIDKQPGLRPDSQVKSNRLSHTRDGYFSDYQSKSTTLFNNVASQT